MRKGLFFLLLFPLKGYKKVGKFQGKWKGNERKRGNCTSKY